MLAFSYIGLSILMSIIIIFGYYLTLKRSDLNSSKQIKNLLILISIIIGWLAYLLILDQTKILIDTNLPPKFPLLVALPAFISFFIFYRKNRKNNIILSIPSKWLIYFQSFRILVELILLATFIKGFIPQQASFEGLNFDILMGISAPFVAFFIYRKKNFNKTIAKAWNILGIVMILFVAFIIVTSIYQPQIWGSTEPLVSNEFLSFPYFLVATYLAPLGIFIHIVALLQLNHKNWNIGN